MLKFYMSLSVAALSAATVFGRALNNDESKVGPHELEDPLTFADGTKLVSPDQLPARRAEILRIFEREMYGRTPPAPETVVTELYEEGVAFDGLGIRRQYHMWFRKDLTGPCADSTLRSRSPRSTR